ncbi:PREDICTED: poly, partial [Prunus dulcis]
VYMLQPLGFVDSNFPSHVCKLRKALYGLKQAPRAWYKKLSSFLLSHAFTKTLSDASLFIYHHGFAIIYFLVYVDDLIVIGNNSSTLSKFLHDLAQEFDMTDLGRMRFFLGIEVLQRSDGIYICQRKYALE